MKTGAGTGPGGKRAERSKNNSRYYAGKISYMDGLPCIHVLLSGMKAVQKTEKRGNWNVRKIEQQNGFSILNEKSKREEI